MPPIDPRTAIDRWPLPPCNANCFPLQIAKMNASSAETVMKKTWKALRDKETTVLIDVSESKKHEHGEHQAHRQNEQRVYHLSL